MPQRRHPKAGAFGAPAIFVVAGSQANIWVYH